MIMQRAFWVWLHRWAGLAIAAFLIVMGLTGSQISEGWHNLMPFIYKLHASLALGSFGLSYSPGRRKRWARLLQKDVTIAPAT